MTILLCFLVFILIISLFSVMFVLIMHIGQKYKKENYFMLSVEEFPPNWNSGGIINIITDDGAIKLKIEKFIDDSHILVKEVK